MNTVMSKEELAHILDQAVQDVTECTAGMRLCQGQQSPGKDLCTVQVTFDRGFRTSLSLCSDTEVLYRMACKSFHEDSVSSEDLEEFSKEYLNVLCGRIAGAMFRATHIPAHFGPPVFYHGRYEPEGREVQLVLTYSDEYCGGVQLIHHVPCSGKNGDVSGKPDREEHKNE